MTGRVVVVGGANMDVVARTAAPMVLATSNPGRARISPGGVGRNVAECLARLGVPTALVSVVGSDAFGDEVLRVSASAGVDVSGVQRSDAPTGTYAALLDDRGELVAAVADMAAGDGLDLSALDLSGAAVVVLDGNLSPVQASRVVDVAAKAGVPVAWEPVSVAKAARLAPLLERDVDWLLVTPNTDELAALTGIADRRGGMDLLHARGVEHVWVRCGPDGSWLGTRDREPVHLPAAAAQVVDVTGAGDSMLAAWLAAWTRGADPVSAARTGHLAAAATIESHHTVRPDLAAVLDIDQEENRC